MRIGLMGAPGSGKTNLAEALEDAVVKKDIADECDCSTPVEIIDDYAVEVEDITELATGFLGGYLANLHVAFERENRERLSSAKTVITCGTLLDTATYATSGSLANLRLGDEAEQQDELRRIEAVMKVFSCMYVDTFMYDYVFYLPAVGDDNINEFDKNLQVAFSVFNLTPVTPLLFETTEERLAKAMEVIYEG